MKIGIIGLSHLGLVFTAGFAKLGHKIVAVDKDAAVIIREITNNNLRIAESGLTDLLKLGISKNRIRLTNEFSLLRDCRVIILSLDTPVDVSENLDQKPILNLIDLAIPHLAVKSLLLISSQVIVGTCDLIQEKINTAKPRHGIEVVYFPENLRVGQAIEYFFKADRFVIGTKSQKAYKQTTKLLKKITAKKIWMDIRSAEISKHALNACLALQVSFINEIADVCDVYGADIAKVSEALKLDSRIGAKAYLNAGLGITSPPLIRELKNLLRLARKNRLSLSVISGILKTNFKQPEKIILALKAALGKPLEGKTVGIFGLSYKERTGFVGKSAAPLIIKSLENSGIQCQIYQPVNFGAIFPAAWHSPYSAAENCNALLFLNPEKEFLNLDWSAIGKIMKNPKIVFDARNFLPKSDLEAKGFRYVAIGRKGKSHAA